MLSKESSPLHSASASDASAVGSREAAATTPAERRDLGRLAHPTGQQLNRSGNKADFYPLTLMVEVISARSPEVPGTNRQV